MSLLKTDKDLTERLRYLKEKGIIDGKANYNTTAKFVPSRLLPDSFADVGQMEKDIRIRDELRYQPWFVLDDILAHECAHVSRAYYYGVEHCQYTHGPLFQRYYHIPFKFLRESMLYLSFAFCWSL